MDKEAKEALFNELYQLDDDEPEEEDLSTAELILRQSKPVAERNRRIHTLRSDRSLGRTVSAPLPEGSTLTNDRIDSSVNASLLPTMLLKKRNDMVDDASHHVAQPSNATATKRSPKFSGKRKRGRSLSPMPESQQIFKGLSFFFFPNNDIAPSRAFRIRKAMEWGVVWIREWKSSVTHVIVDNNLCYNDLLSFLKIDALPFSVILVNETYPVDCIIYRILVNPYQQQYRVRGHVEPYHRQQSLAPALSSDISLQLKPGKGEYLELGQTPARTEASVQDSVGQSDDANFSGNINHANSPPGCSKQPSNALDEAIEEAKALKDLPLDIDDDDNRDGSSVFIRSEGDQSEDEKIVQPRLKGPYENSWQGNFSCMSKHDGTGISENPNSRTIEVLQKMADYYYRTQDHWRLTAYRKAIGALRKQSTRITTAKEATRIPFIGERLADKIEEIVWTNRLRRLDNTDLEPNDETFQLFRKIYGVGLAQASMWINQGHRTIDDLLAKVQLTRNQRIGIEHFDDFQTRIPRQEIERHDQYMRNTCSKVDASIELIIGGSYRRGAADSGDIDFIVTKPECAIEVLRKIVLETIIPTLFDEEYLKVGLATTSKEDGTKWHGAAALPGTSIWRRIDFLLVPWDELGAALIYFTGNDIFNRSIRLLASKKGMRLNQRGLWKDVVHGKNRARGNQGTLVEGKDEKKIFGLLGVPWRPPHHRIC